mgnify:CR=1 FL=1
MKGNLDSYQIGKLMKLLQKRFLENVHRHKDIEWELVSKLLKKNPQSINSIYQMEVSGGEPDVVKMDDGENKLIYVDCSTESPLGRRSLCYDEHALNSRKEHKPKDSVINMAKAMGIEVLDERRYRFIQKLDCFDTKTSSWVLTPSTIRHLGGALFCDRRYNTVFIYHNGAESYYAARGFRGYLEL